MKPPSPDVEKYLSSLPEERREALQTVRQLILENLSPGFEEGLQYGMLGYYVPHSFYPKGYHANPKEPLPCIGLASQKNHMALYLMCLYAGSDLERSFKETWEKSGKKLDMGKSCVRFRKLEELAFDAVAQTLQQLTVEQHITNHEAAVGIASASATASGVKTNKATAASVKKRPPPSTRKPPAG